MKRRLFVPVAALLFALVLIPAANVYADEIAVTVADEEEPEVATTTVEDIEIPEYITIRGRAVSTSLTELDLRGGGCLRPLTDRQIDSLRYMTSLTTLHLSGNQISDLTPLANLTNLEVLILGRNRISDLTPLANLTNLTQLDMCGNRIGDLTPLSNLTNLEQLCLVQNRISDLAPLSNLTNLRQLRLGCRITVTDWSPVDHVRNVQGRPHRPR